VVFSFLNPDNIFSRYAASKKYTEDLTKPFPEFERIARNRPFDGIDPSYPKTTDGTTASIIRKTPRRIVQQLPTGVVESDDEAAWLPIIAQYVYTHKILPYADEDYDLIQKSWLAIEGGLSFGSTASYTPFINHDGYFSPDMTLPYWGDLFLQRGKKSGYACSYVFMRSHWQKADVEALIDSETKLKKSAKERGEKYDPTWDIEGLRKVLDSQVEKDSQSMTPNEKDRALETSGIELVTGFQKGVGAKFFTFNPATDTIVRTKVNKDPRGKMPIDWMYGDIDGNNPLGRGIIELIGGLQNLIDSDMQMYQFNRALALAPPVIKYGNIGNFKYAPNTVVNARNDPNAKIVPLVIDTTAIANYPQLYGLQKSQLLNLVNSPDTSIGAEVGNPSFGKTPAALNQQKATISVDDNYIRKMFETWFGNWSETAINLYFAERSGVEELQLDKDSAKKLRKLGEEGKFDMSLLSEDNKIMIDYDTATPALKFRVDASTSKMKDDSDQLAALQSLLSMVDQSQTLSQLVPPEKILGAWNSIVAASGVEDPEELSIDIEAFMQEQEQAKQMQMQQQQMQQEQAMAQQQAPQEMPPEMPPEMMQETPQEEMMMEEPMPEEMPMDEMALEEEISQLDQEDQMIVEQLQALGMPDDLIQQAIDMLEQGASADEVLMALGVTNEQR
jgi:hypothetical protein